MQQVSQTELKELTAFINDATTFVQYFAIPMAKSAPHVYLSTLPFAPTCSLVFMHYSSMFSQMLHIKSGRLSHWPSLEMVISHPGEVNSIAISSDGQHIVSGSYDKTICVWNTMTGELVAGPFSGHSDRVTSVAFSPDGQHIVSGSDDKTICVWNTMTGELVAGPFSGHSDWVTSVAFSPDGQHIVSGSSDKTICVWNTMTGELVAGPFSGHSSWVTSVAFSPDGQHIVSGSKDQAIYLWNTMTRGTELETETTRQVNFTDQSMINDEGWICGSKNELLMWIPPLHRIGLHRSSTVWVAAKHKTHLDLSTFKHGNSWSTCYTPRYHCKQ